MTSLMMTAAQEPPWKTVRPRPRPPDGAGWHHRDGIEVGVNDAGAAPDDDQAGGTFWGGKGHGWFPSA